ncbi:hypothetical protein BN59_01842 [Legionella massiliensis]|uniref:Uncharacterized protein n=1 Tax=Legionella massiliensis TaxID=1034943 RepID=A0A078L0I5_9GAMM|nr:hypothetical protein [Legionella massiliensis]CDZ77559.1 hypothetical protein BN59_01842 [Legionella massiliensis]CEE13297.1 hypothetical protein BN1094_01842 [Legionella massiliensis]
MSTMANLAGYQENIDKCNKINECLPKLCLEIRELQMVADHFTRNKDLESSLQLLSSISTLDRGNNNEEKITFVYKYQECLVLGLNQLAQFFQKFKYPEALNEKQRDAFGAIATNIAISQQTISNIATN